MEIARSIRSIFLFLVSRFRLTQNRWPILGSRQMGQNLGWGPKAKAELGFGLGGHCLAPERPALWVTINEV